MRLRITYANVTSTLALFFAMGGASYAAANLPPDSVGTAQLQPHSVGATQLKNQSVGTVQLQPRSVGTVQLKNQSVGTAELQPRSVGTAQLKNNSVGSTQLQNGSVGSNQLAPASVRIDKLAADSVGSAQIQPDAVTSYQIAPGAVGARGVEQGSLLYSDFSTDEVSPRIFGEVHTDGTLGSSSGVSTSYRARTGVYGVSFDQDVTGCVAVASIGPAASNAGGTIPYLVSAYLDDSRDLYAAVIDPGTGTPEDAQWSFVVDC